MNGANDLEEFGTLNLNQMEEIGSNADINLVVQFKRIKGRYDTGDGDWSGTRRYYVQSDGGNGRINSMILSEHPSSDAGKWETLQEFVQWGTQTYPAEKYALVVWNHGAGWRKVPLSKTRGVSYDDTTDSHIDTIDIPKAIDMGSGRKWDVLLWDSSLMQMAEVAYEVRDKTQIITGSEESPPGEGYPYQLFLRDLANNPTMDGRTFGISVMNRTIESYGVDSNITQSVLDASKVGAIPEAINALGAALTSAQGRFADEIVAAREDAESYDYVQNKDALDFIRLLMQPLPGSFTPPVNDPGVQQAAQRARDTIQAAIIANVNSQGHPRSNGLALFVPSPAQYRRIDVDQANGFGQRYNLISFAKAAPAWHNFLQNGPE
jgi:hypothetical protein